MSLDPTLRRLELDAFNAGPDVRAWVGAGACSALAGKGVSAVAPAGGAWSLHTGWDMDGSNSPSEYGHDAPTASIPVNGGS